MLGKRSKQLGFLEADHLYLDYVGRGSFYGFLASLRGQLFRDEDFAELYCPDNGRDSVAPSLVATALLLQAYDKVSDLEAKQRADFDIRWKVALGIEVEDRPFAKSTLQLFRAQLILHDRVRAVFQRSLQFARQTGCLKGRRMKVAVDTTYILGQFDPAVCGVCPLRSQCVAAGEGKGRTVTLHPQEALCLVVEEPQTSTSPTARISASHANGSTKRSTSFSKPGPSRNPLDGWGAIMSSGPFLFGRAPFNRPTHLFTSLAPVRIPENWRPETTWESGLLLPRCP